MGGRAREPRPSQPQTAHNKAITTRLEGGDGVTLLFAVDCFGKLAHHGVTLSWGIRGVTTHTNLFPFVSVIIPFVVLRLYLCQESKKEVCPGKNGRTGFWGEGSDIGERSPTSRLIDHLFLHDKS